MLTPLALGAATGGSGLVGFWLLVSLPGVLVVAVLAARLLGARRSLLANLLSGLVGWLAGVGLSTLIAQGQPDPTAGFIRNVWVFSTIFAMGATVFAELLARPGALARAQSGLSRLPRPLHALRRRARRISRYAQITSIAMRYGLGPVLGLSRAEPDVDDSDHDARAPTARRLRLALEEAGGVFLKLGQVLSTRSDLLPARVCDELARLQDSVPAAAPADMRRLLEAEVGPADEVFAEFDWTPLGTASIGQAYRARLHTGEAVVVKVQRPGIRAAIERDIDVLTELARMMEDRTSWGREYRVRELADEFVDQLRDELDFRAEARNAEEIRSNLPPDGSVRVPRVHGEWTTGQVLVMDWFDGPSVQHVDGLDGARRRELADELMRTMLQQVLVDGRFHADPHPGNILVLGERGEAVGLIDFGAAGRLDPVQQTALRDLLVGVVRRDPGQLRDAVLQVAELRRDLDEDALERAVARFVARQLGPGATPSAQMLGELLTLCFAFGLTLPPELSTVFRAIGTLEGTLRVLSPGYLAIDAAQRIAGEWAREAVSPSALPNLARDEVMRVLPVLRRLPYHVDRLASMAQRGRLTARVSLFSQDGDQRFITVLVNRAILAFLGGTLGVLSAILLVSTTGPAFTGVTTLFQFFGYFGLFCATVLILRVLVAVLRDRLN
jgi:ubiquinone biosynthesis protein